MALSDAIFVGRPDVIKLAADGKTIVNLDEALAEAASDATEITVLGGYYDRLWLLKLLKKLPRTRRRACRVRIAVGSDATVTLPKVWDHMRELYRELWSIGYRSIEIGIVGRSPVHFHTKLFRFLRTTRPYWFIGSANPGSERHELMLRLSGKHDELSNYVNAVFAAAHSVQNEMPQRERADNLRDFLLDGVLAHKPPRQQLFTFDAYKLSESDRKLIDMRLGEGSGVEHASPRTEGFGFGLRSAIGMEADKPIGEEEGAERVRFRDHGVDTLFGLWMPSAYARKIQGTVFEREIANEDKLRLIGERLADPDGQEAASSAFQRYVQSMDAFLADLGIAPKPVRDRDEAFARYLKSRTNSLSNEAFRQRHARVMTLAPMFDVWQDPDTAAEFERSFFDDIAWRAKPESKRRSRVIRSLIESLGDDTKWQTGEGLQQAFKKRLKVIPWGSEEWEE